jgi:hypothetical protein
MTHPELTELVKFLVQLRAENLAFRQVLETGGQIGSAGLDDLIAEKRRGIESLPMIAYAVKRADPNNLPMLLDTLSTVRPQ